MSRRPLRISHNHELRFSPIWTQRALRGATTHTVPSAWLCGSVCAFPWPHHHTTMQGRNESACNEGPPSTAKTEEPERNETTETRDSFTASLCHAKEESASYSANHSVSQPSPQEREVIKDGSRCAAVHNYVTFSNYVIRRQFFQSGPRRHTCWSLR
ncbi:uncharacterized protein LOC135099794 isoform X2 [Scylla paramamosain]|uniref:uncharacterized protein LOC135099794 isoform X2 n=1 Tax=Scylla paramamosain TaxID=85552 RepID=UPI003082BBC9